ncbi:DUF397 domain-containing protein [Streptomyces sp. Sge12]|uniref:DUF397 domain-containing protein n=1 Tax=Streptomyces sp. Sge12 TaxID=1972846 RepID=UPI0009C28C58|nr:DUF397 domain-containing protein [Streptomyces sp. Sge12]ARE76374.1 DUF397 domain-containing protein [Streptomyces sp. Sge12]
MGSIQNLTGARWRKSSYSGSSGGDCVECTPLGGAAWREAAYSGTTGGDGRVAVRDSKNPGGPVFTVTADAFGAFVRSL